MRVPLWLPRIETLLIAGVLACGDPAVPFDGVHDFTAELSSGGATRTALVHVPAGYDGSRAVPLVLVLHGSFGSGAVIRDYTGLDLIADELGFVVAYPDAVPNWDYEGQDDLEFMFDLVDQLRGRLSLRAERVYALGISRGGLFALHLACDAADGFAGIGIVVATLRQDLGDRCRPVTRLPVVLVVGSEDGSTHLQGGVVSGYLSADSTIGLFAQRNGCDLGRPRTVSAAPDLVPDNRTVRFEAYAGCPGGAFAELWVVDGGTHEWYRGDMDTGRALAQRFFAPR